MLTDKQKQQVQDAVRKALLDALLDADLADKLGSTGCSLPAAADADTDALFNCYTDAVDAYLYALQQVLQPSKRKGTRRSLGLAAHLVQVYVQTGKDVQVRVPYNSDSSVQRLDVDARHALLYLV